MSRDNWARLVEAVVRREEIWQMFHDHSRTPSISTIASDQDDDPTNHFSGQLITNDSFKALSVSPPVSLRNPVVAQAVSKNADSTGPFPRKLFSSWYRRRKPKDHSLVDITTPERKTEVATSSETEGQVIACHTVEAWNEQIDQKGEDNKQKLIVVDFSASWCGPCLFIAPFFAELSTKVPNVTFLKVDVDELKSVASEWKVTAMPTFIFLKEGQVLDRVVGSKKEELQQTIDKHLTTVTA